MITKQINCFKNTTDNTGPDIINYLLNICSSLFFAKKKSQFCFGMAVCPTPNKNGWWLEHQQSHYSVWEKSKEIQDMFSLTKSHKAPNFGLFFFLIKKSPYFIVSHYFSYLSPNTTLTYKYLAFLYLYNLPNAFIIIVSFIFTVPEAKYKVFFFI